MDLIDRYLNAVAAQLPADARDDITAELRDLILSRFEDREEALGRPLTEDEQLEILREVGHPLVVAARYGKGPDSLIGPTLFPWWLFGVKAGLMLLTCVVLIGAIVQAAVGDASIGQAIGQGFHDWFSGAITLIALATLGGYILERHVDDRPAFLDRWRPEDLSLFEVTRLEKGAFGRAADAAGRCVNGGASARPAVRGHAANALFGAAWALIVFLWWIGAFDVAGLTPQSIGGEVYGVDYGPIARSMVATLFWPVFVYLLCRLVFDLARVGASPLRPDHVRGMAAGEFALAAARLAGWIWVWQASALAPVIGFDGIDGLIARLSIIGEGRWPLDNVLTVVALAATAEAAGSMAVNAWRMVSRRR